MKRLVVLTLISSLKQFVLSILVSSVKRLDVLTLISSLKQFVLSVLVLVNETVSCVNTDIIIATLRSVNTGIGQ